MCAWDLQYCQEIGEHQHYFYLPCLYSSYGRAKRLGRIKCTKDENPSISVSDTYLYLVSSNVTTASSSFKWNLHIFCSLQIQQWVPPISALDISGFYSHTYTAFHLRPRGLFSLTDWVWLKSSASFYQVHMNLGFCCSLTKIRSMFVPSFIMRAKGVFKTGWMFTKLYLDFFGPVFPSPWNSLHQHCKPNLRQYYPQITVNTAYMVSTENGMSQGNLPERAKTLF